MTPRLKHFLHVVITWAMNRQLRRFLKRHPQVRIVAVTGSVGKTTTKLAIAPVLAKKYRVQAHPGNYNSETGVPLGIFELESPGSILRVSAWARIIWEMEKRLRRPFPYDIIVQEIGASHVSDISYFSFLHPEIGVVTATKPAHLEGFGSLQNIIEEKFQLARYSQTALINAEELRLMDKIKELPSDKVKTYGLGRGDYSFEQTTFSHEDGFRGTMRLLGGESFKVHLQLVAKHNVQSAVAAVAVGHMMGVPVEGIKAALDELHPVNGRMNPLPGKISSLAGKNGSLIIDDSYNASPEAVTAALETLYSMPGRKIAILGGMNELGTESARYHREIGEQLGQLDLLVTIAEFAKQYVDPARVAGLTDSQIKSFDTPYEAGEYVAKLLHPGDKVLVKGSQGGIFSEEATAKLLLNSDDAKRLVRQSAFWQGVKRQAFEKNAPTHED